jgi:hypothetical protein
MNISRTVEEMLVVVALLLVELNSDTMAWGREKSIV